MDKLKLIIEAIDEAYNEIDEIVKCGDIATSSDVATLFVKGDGSATVIFPDQSSHKIKYSNVFELINEVRAMGYEIVIESTNLIEQVVSGGKFAVFPLVKRLTPFIPRPTHYLPEPARTYNEIEIVRRLVERKLRNKLYFKIMYWYHTKPLKALFDKEVSFFTEPKPDDRHDFNQNQNAVWLAKITTVKITTRADFITIVNEVIANSSPSEDDFISPDVKRLSIYGDGSISLDTAWELLMDSIRYGEFVIPGRIRKNEIVFTIPALGLQYDRPTKIVKNLFTNTTYIPEHPKYINRSTMIVFYNIPPAYISFDIYRYVKTTKIDRSAIISGHGRGNHSINFNLNESKIDDRLKSYFANPDDEKKVEGYMEVGIIALAF